MNEILYEPYHGSEPFIFLRFDRADRKAAVKIINSLIDRRFRVCYDQHDNKTVPDYEGLAARILSADLSVFLISSGALSNLSFRNSINFALSRKKDVFCIYLDDQEMQHGFDIQLANIPGINASLYKDADSLCGEIVTNGLFIQDLRGENAKIPKRVRRKKAAIIAIAAVLIVFIASGAAIAAYRVGYENSTAGRIENISAADYLDISSEDPSLIGLLEGKTIKNLVARNMGLTDISALASVNCEELDISQNPGINTLEPLLENQTLQVVKVSQDMFPSIRRVGGNHPFKIVITG